MYAESTRCSTHCTGSTDLLISLYKFVCCTCFFCFFYLSVFAQTLDGPIATLLLRVVFEVIATWQASVAASTEQAHRVVAAVLHAAFSQQPDIAHALLVEVFRSAFIAVMQNLFFLN